MDCVGTSTCEGVRQPFPAVSNDVCSVDFCMSSILGIKSKASLSFFMARSVRCAGFCTSRPSCMCCVSVMQSVVVECSALKPC